MASRPLQSAVPACGWGREAIAPNATGCLMVDRAALLRLARALPAGAAVPVPVGWLLELLEDTSTAPDPIAPVEADLTCAEVGLTLHRSPVTIRNLCATGALEGYRLRGREWRVSRAALAAFLQAEQTAHKRK
jgi:Helix-turn-helix domain